jgi:hypothetical protein
MTRENFKEILERYYVSGQTQPMFCKAEGVTFYQFQYYLRRYGKVRSGKPVVREKGSFTPIEVSPTPMTPSGVFSSENKPWLRITTAKGLVFEFSSVLEAGYVDTLLGNASI